MNLYAYVGNNPVRFRDPSGQKTGHVELSAVASRWFGGSYGGAVVFDDSGNIGFAVVKQGTANPAGRDTEIRLSGGFTREKTIFEAYNGTSLQYGGSEDIGRLGFGAEVIVNPESGEEFPWATPDGLELSVAYNLLKDAEIEESITMSLVKSEVVGSINVFEMMDDIADGAAELVGWLYPSSPRNVPIDRPYRK